MDLTDIYRTFNPDTEEYTFFSIPYGAFSKIDHMVSNKENLNRYKIIGITSYILSDHYGLKSELKTTLIAETLQFH